MQPSQREGCSGSPPVFRACHIRRMVRINISAPCVRYRCLKPGFSNIRPYDLRLLADRTHPIGPQEEVAESPIHMQSGRPMGMGLAVIEPSRFGAMQRRQTQWVQVDALGPAFAVAWLAGMVCGTETGLSSPAVCSVGRGESTAAPQKVGACDVCIKPQGTEPRGTHRHRNDDRLGGAIEPKICQPKRAGLWKASYCGTPRQRFRSN